MYGRFSSNPRSKTGFYNLGRELNCACRFLCTRSCDAMYYVRERKSKLKLFYRFFMDLFCRISLAPGFNTCLKAGFLASILTSGRQPKHMLLSLKKTVVSHLKVTISWDYVVVEVFIKKSVTVGFHVRIFILGCLQTIHLQVESHYTTRTAPRFVCSTKLSPVQRRSHLDGWPKTNSPCWINLFFS